MICLYGQPLRKRVDVTHLGQNYDAVLGPHYLEFECFVGFLVAWCGVFPMYFFSRDPRNLGVFLRLLQKVAKMPLFTYFVVILGLG